MKLLHANHPRRPSRSPAARRRRVLGVLIAGSLAVAACGDDDASSSPSSTVSTTAPTVDSAPGSTAGPATTDAVATSAPSTPSQTGECETSSGPLTVAMFAAPRSLDPLTLTSGLGGLTEGAAIFDTLLRYDAAADEYVAHMAASIESNDTFDRWTLTLRDGVVFPDGTPLDAAAVVANITRQQNPALRSSNAGLLRLVTATNDLDSTTVEFQLSEPWPGFPFVLTQGPGMIANPAAIADFATTAIEGTPPPSIGAGPYVVQRWAANEAMELEANPDYWGTVPCTQSLRLKAIPGGEATLDAFDAGDVDIAIVNEPKVLREVDESNVEHLQRFAGIGIILMNADPDGTAATADVRVRQAVALGLDTTDLLRRSEDGAGTALQGAVVPPDVKEFSGIEGPAFDPRAAAALVEDVKTETGWDGSIRWTCHSALNDLALAVQAQLGAIGMNVVLDIKPSSTELITAVYTERSFDMACWGLRYGVDEDLWTTFSSNLQSTSGINRTGWGSPIVDAALDDLRSSTSVDERAAALARIQTVLNEEVPVYSMRVNAEAVVWRAGIEGVSLGQNGVVDLAALRGG